jgi:hypothetical protein
MHVAEPLADERGERIVVGKMVACLGGYRRA